MEAKKEAQAARAAAGVEDLFGDDDEDEGIIAAHEEDSDEGKEEGEDSEGKLASADDVERLRRMFGSDSE